MEEKKVAKTASKTTAKTAAKTTKTTSKATSKKATTRTSTTRRKKADIEDIESIESIEDEDVTKQIKRRRKLDEKRFDTGLSLGAKIAIIVVLAVIIILLLLKGCKNKGEYTVKFNSNGGNEISEQVIKANDKVKAPTDPTKDGYKFVGWYVDGKRFDFDTKIKKDLVIEAKWESEGNSEVSGVTIDQKELAILPGDTVTLVATVEPEDAKDKDVKWESSDESIATVDENGKVTAKAVGSATITVTTNEKGFTATCRVVVSDNVVKVTGIEVSPTRLNIAVGDAERVTATVSPANATNKGVTWTSSDNSIATVSSTGVIRGVGDGEATITATTKDGDKKATVTVRVDEVKVKSLTVQPLTVGLNKTAQLVYKIEPSNAAVKTVEWKSTDTDIATVDSKGVVTGKKEGKVKIIGTIKDKGGEHKGEAWVTVTKPVAVSGVTIECPSQVYTGKTATISATIKPNNAVNKRVTWNKVSGVGTVQTSSANPPKAKFTAGNDEGTATISVTTADGGYKAECTIEVKKAPENAADYAITFTGTKDELGNDPLQYVMSVTRKGAAFNNFQVVIYNNKPIRSGGTLRAGDKAGTTASIKLDDTTTLNNVKVNFVIKNN